ncbi:MAG: NADH-quinone oxidoreductase subunit J [Candidatus Electryonea clarkiae]|nr:NADH-quinone oxidoreductase subunit J [Candidatus Electryonea clarkiae]MDP8288069.1 NADH-quinone oxidoreductase subunit J [Candidatus Electryonea clarkiae]
MQGVMFIVLALVTLFSALMVITRKDPVSSILYLVLTFFCFAGFYVLLGAQFLAAVQIIVYAGAIAVLFLFVVMMLNLREPEAEEGKELIPIWKPLGYAVGIGVGIVFLSYLASSPGPAIPPLNGGDEIYAMGRADFLGKALFTDFILPFEIAGVLLLAAVLGAVALAKKKRV